MSDEDTSRYYMEGVNRFQNARSKAFWREMISLLRGKPAELLSFDDIRTRLRLREESYKGLQNVPLDRIVGSVGRYRDFTQEFLPKNAKMQQRWSRVYAQVNAMEGTPPIELYQIDDVYFVRDGNHRVSVARQMGQSTIEAHVTELPTSIDLEPGMSEQEWEAAEAYARFLSTTRLNMTRPHHQAIKLTEPKLYVDLLGHVYLHQRALQLEGQCDCDLPGAAADWYDNVYRPAITLIRKYEVMQYFSGRTEGDLYVWLVEHLGDVKAELGDDATVRTFSHALTDLLMEKHKPIPEDLLKEQDDSVILTRSEVQEALEAYKAKLAIGE